METTPRDEMDSLLEALLRFAQEMLEKRGEFYPVGAVIDSDRQLQLVAADVGEERPDSSAVIDGLYDGFRNQAAAAQIRGSAGDPVDVLLPYAKRRLRGFDYGQLFAQAGTSPVFRR